MKSKIWSKDATYASTKFSVERSKSEIDNILRKYGVKDIAWRFDPEHDDIEVHFQVEEEIAGQKLSPVIRIKPPEIWKRVRSWAKRRQKLVKAEIIYWPQSMRCLFWYIKSHLEMTKLGYSKTHEFLPHINLELPNGTQAKIGDIIIPRIHKVGEWPALTEKQKAS